VQWEQAWRRSRPRITFLSPMTRQRVVRREALCRHSVSRRIRLGALYARHSAISAREVLKPALAFKLPLHVPELKVRFQ